MSGYCYEAESAVVLPAGMELVVPPPAKDEADQREHSTRHGEGGRSGQVGPVGVPAFARRGGPRRAPTA